ncbi:enterochelin esterase-like enzyme [Kribbella aluminosa]|uniref:Enterochelin esterase-like enzyme n=1 Tax=Kribbella aluminosa TaxID=416017 RepID=A0ABS4UTP9_9ACTN|nr:alpha/beta hydrolase-fold protein [Kribbella aluminosa]MBP2355017.1 enterochelin esterase-like enzyme [Kribbella aluminosa]
METWSLLGGWFPVTVQVVAGGVLLVAVGWRDRWWRWRVLPVIVGVTVILAVLAAYPGAKAVRQVDPVPFLVWFWLGATVGALLVLVVGWRSARWWRRGTALVAVGLAAFAGANGINQFVGYYPTLGAAFSDWTHKPLPGETSLPGAVRAAGAAHVPAAGKLVAVDIPATYSHFKHRQELVYLPPIWFVGHRRPTLPVVELVGGERGGPGDWVRLGNAIQVADAYAHLHRGYAPILVFADATGHFDNDTECVNGPRGNAADHLAKDIPKYVEKTFGASSNPQQWAVGGFSMGGTCALDLVVEYPHVFNHFVDVSGDLAPYTGTPAQTLQDLYGGNVAVQHANEALRVMRAHGRYTNVTGLFLTSTEEVRHQHQAQELSRAAAAVGIKSLVEITPGTHTWQFAAPAFGNAFPWLVDQLTHRAPA